MFDWIKRLVKGKAAENNGQFTLQQEDEYRLGIFESTPDAQVLPEEKVVFFPDLETVFDRVEPGDENLFFPLCSFPLSEVLAGGQGYAHFIYTFREYSEYRADKYYNQYSGDYVLGFRQLGDKVELLADKKILGYSLVYEKYLQEEGDNYRKAKKNFQQQGLSCFGEKQDLRYLIRQAGSKPVWSQSNATPAVAGTVFIGQVRAVDFIGKDQDLFLFFDPKERVFYQIEQY
jgi:hypothetical protein